MRWEIAVVDPSTALPDPETPPFVLREERGLLRDQLCDCEWDCDVSVRSGTGVRSRADMKRDEHRQGWIMHAEPLT